MTNDFNVLKKKYDWREIFNPKFWFDRLAWFFLIFGVVELVVWHRVFGYLAIVTGIAMLIINHMKHKQIGPYKPVPETAPGFITKARTNDLGFYVRLFIPIILGLAIGSLMFYGGYKLKHWGDVTRDSECYKCPNPKCNWLFNKDACSDCNRSKLDEQEYGSNNTCNDMGSTEMAWKIGMALMIMGIIIPVLYCFMTLYTLWHLPKTDVG